MAEQSRNNIASGENIFRWQKIALKLHEYQIEEAWKRLTDAGFRPLLIKGWAAAQYYDEPAERSFNDLDIAFAADEFEQAESFLKEKAEDLTIDLHKELKHLDTQPFNYLYLNSQLIRCGKTDVRVLCREDHLRILCVHWLIDGGAKKDKLRDIYYAVENRPADFDWEKCLNVVSLIRQRWILYTIGLAHRYLGLAISDLPFADELKQIPEWLIKAVEKEWQSDTFIIPLHLVLKDWKTFRKQIAKRIPPNPIQATVEMEGDFDKYPRLFYQIGSVFFRSLPSVKRVFKSSMVMSSENEQKSSE